MRPITLANLAKYRSIEGNDLIKRLLSETSESRYLEWKVEPPPGPPVDTSYKYRVVKNVISFANADGGFIVFGVDDRGRVRGLDDADIAQIDLAKLTELVNSFVSPDIEHIDLVYGTSRGKQLAVLHIAPSPHVPHVTTKSGQVKTPSGPKRILAKHAVYYRHAAKSALATPSQHQRLVNRRTRELRDELLRRIKEIPVPFPETGARTALRSGSVRLTTDVGAPPVRRARRREDADTVLVHEGVSEALFEEINNVLSVNDYLAENSGSFVLGEHAYYRVYAQRLAVEPTGRRRRELASWAFDQLYAPGAYWLTQMPPREIAALLQASAGKMATPQIYGVLRLAIVLGDEVSAWFKARLEKQYARQTQKPNFYFSYGKMLTRTASRTRVLAALDATESAVVPQSQPAYAVWRPAGGTRPRE